MRIFIIFQILKYFHYSFLFEISFCWKLWVVEQSLLEPRAEEVIGPWKIVRPSLYAKGKAQRMILHERVESWIIIGVEDKIEYCG